MVVASLELVTPDEWTLSNALYASLYIYHYNWIAPYGDICLSTINPDL